MITRRTANTAFLSGAILAAAPGLLAAEDVQTIELPEPRKEGGKPLIQALMARRSIREYSSRPLPPQILSDLLWAALGVNRPASGDRTAPSWRHFIAIDIFVAMASGTWRYEPARYRLLQHSHEDIRAVTGTQDFVATAPVNLVYVANGARMGDASPEDRRLYAFTDTGFVGQNVYLFCASEGLATVVRGAVDRDMLARTMRLERSQFVTLAQTVGFPKE